MKNLIIQLDKAFESRVRLGIMALLLVNETVEFNTLKAELQVSDGNLASHLSGLEKAGYLLVNKQFIGKKPNTTYRATAAGKEAFNKHLNILEQIIQQRN
ncbi:MAG: winged helix-turn-helix domain-containing protein [Chitinophagaceae bacterium]